MTPADHLAMAYPALVAGLAEDVTAWALAVAADYRPRCLSEERQNLAQAHYAAHLLTARAEQQAAAAGGAPSGPVIEQREGDVTLRYGAAAAGTPSPGPSAPYAAWKALSDLCSRGAIVTRFG